MDIINFGSLNIDHVYSVGTFVRPGETLAAGQYNVFCGGKGLNQSIAAARAGGRVFHAGAVGQGGKMLLDMLEESGVDTSLLLHSTEPQGHAIIQVAESGENCILLFRGSNFAVTPAYVDQVFAQIQAPAYIMLQNEISCLPYIIQRASECGFTVVLNASPIDRTILELDLNQVSWLMINEIEGGQITGQEQPELILDTLAQRYPKLSVLLTLGKNGSVCQQNGVRTYQGIYPVQAVDTTAAGDTFSGYFVASLAAGRTIKQAMDQAALASAIAVTREGAAPSIPTADEVRQTAGAQG